MSAKALNHIIPKPEHEEPMGPLTEGLKTLLTLVVALVVWIAAIYFFGYAGLIVPALTLVALIGGFIVWVSRG